MERKERSKEKDELYHDSMTPDERGVCVKEVKRGGRKKGGKERG